MIYSQLVYYRLYVYTPSPLSTFLAMVQLPVFWSHTLLMASYFIPHTYMHSSLLLPSSHFCNSIMLQAFYLPQSDFSYFVYSVIGVV